MRWWTALCVVACLACSPVVYACDPPKPSFEHSYMKQPLRGGSDIRLQMGFGMATYQPINRRRMHHGLDWIASAGTPVVAAASGQVVVADTHVVIGKTVVIDHGDGWETRYQHLANLTVSSGECVRRGQLIGTVGSTGNGFHIRGTVAANSTPAILHYEVLQHGKHRNPLRLNQ